MTPVPFPPVPFRSPEERNGTGVFSAGQGTERNGTGGVSDLEERNGTGVEGGSRIPLRMDFGRGRRFVYP